VWQFDGWEGDRVKIGVLFMAINLSSQHLLSWE